MFSSPAISVLLPVYKEPLIWVGRAVESILNQTFTDFELIILVDNPDEPAICDFLKTYEKDERVRCVVNEQNLKLPKTLNKGIALAKAKYIARMDADDIALPERLHHQYNFLEQHPEIALCGAQVEKIDAEGRHLAYSNSCTDMRLLPKITRYINVITHPTWMIRAEVFETVGLYRDFPNAEDYDLLIRIVDAGFQIANLKQVLLQYRINTKGQTWGGSLAQKVCFEYIQDLRLQRSKQQSDNFSVQVLQNKIVFAHTTHSVTQRKAQSYLLQAMLCKSQNHRFLQIFYLLRSLYVSPLQRRYYFRWLAAHVQMYLKTG